MHNAYYIDKLAEQKRAEREKHDAHKEELRRKKAEQQEVRCSRATPTQPKSVLKSFCSLYTLRLV